MKSVAVIGAGPSGLLAARTFSRQTPKAFEVTVFDKQDRVGGMWAVSPGENDKMLNSEMPTNGSRFAESFSDLSWRSVDLHHPSKPEIRSGYVPYFPRAWQVGRYLETYAEKLIPREVLRLNCEVTEAIESRDEHDKRWKLSWRDHINDTSHVEHFDYIVLASGFFAAPRPCSLVPHSDTSKIKKPCVKMVHSSRCRSLCEDVAPRDWDGEGNILVIGGSMSGAEASTALAFQMSSRKHSPKAKSWGAPHVIHIMPHHFYPVPPLLPKADHATHASSFLPSDLFFYNLDRRPLTAPITAGFGCMPPEKAQRSHRGLQSLIGDQKDLHAPALVAENTSEPAYVAITANGMYSEFVRDCTISPVAGRVTLLEYQAGSMKWPSVTATIRHGEEEITLKDIVGVVYATGYTPNPALDFLHPDVKQKLEYDPTSHRLPIILQDHQTHHPSVLNLGFVGFYEAPAWSVAELQARLLAQMWSETTTSPSAANQTNGAPPSQQANDSTLTAMRALRTAMHTRDPTVPQYWNGDTVGLLESLSSTLAIPRDDTGFNPPRSGPVAICRYADALSDLSETKKAQDDLRDLLCASAGGHFVQGAAFRAMHGPWTIIRSLTSRISTMPSGTFTGMAHFHPRAPTAQEYQGEYLYVEEGEFVTKQGFAMRASRRYVFRYSEVTDQITSWFVREDGEVDYLFLKLELQLPSQPPTEDVSRSSSSTAKGASGCGSRKREDGGKEGGSPSNAWTAKATHPCHPDTYEATYEWYFDKVALEGFRVVYNVKGPEKNYVSDTLYKR